jgi:hypothetical protein
VWPCREKPSGVVGEVAAVGVVLVAVEVAAFPGAVVPVAGASVVGAGGVVLVVVAVVAVFLRAVLPVAGIGNPSRPAASPQ